MKPLLFTRDIFRNSVFDRDNHKCIVCNEPAVDSHHIIDRRLFKAKHELGGYFIDNGASLCQIHHILAEQTKISCQELRDLANIKNIILPDHLYNDYEYDKWANIILPNGNRLKGELFYDESVKKILLAGDVLDLFQKYIKYQRTYHLPWSNLLKDDRMLESDSIFYNKRVIVSLKMDGENCLGPDSILKTEDGDFTIKEICDNKYKGKVLSFDINSGKYEFKNIVAHSVLPINENIKWYELELHNGIKIKLTSNHYVFLPKLNVYRMVSELNKDDDVLFLD